MAHALSKSLHSARQPSREPAGAGRSAAEGGGGARYEDAQVLSLEDQAHSAHEEARMVLPGIQALFGFQLIAVFNRRFIDLELFDRSAYLASLILVATAIGLIMAPAAYHRLVERDRVSRGWLRLASREVAWAMAALTPAIAIDVYLVAVMSTGRTTLAVALGCAVAAFLGWMWFGMPLARRHREHSSGERPAGPAARHP